MQFAIFLNGKKSYVGSKTAVFAILGSSQFKHEVRCAKENGNCKAAAIFGVDKSNI
jgi:hypothetical protein